MLAKLQKIICYTLIFTLFNTSFQPLYAFPDFDDDVEESEVSSAPPPPTGPDRMTLTNVSRHVKE